MTKLHITTKINKGFTAAQVGKLATEETFTNDPFIYHLKKVKCGICISYDNFSCISMPDGKHITLHYGEPNKFPEGFEFGSPVVIKLINVSENEAGQCLIVEILDRKGNWLSEQI